MTQAFIAPPNPLDRTRRHVLKTGLLGLCSASNLALSQEKWPAKPITIDVPFPAGAGTNIVVRGLVAGLLKQLGVPVVIDNRAGAGGTVGTAAAGKATPDGYTLAAVTATTAAAATAVHPKLGYNPATDVEPIGLIRATDLELPHFYGRFRGS